MLPSTDLALQEHQARIMRSCAAIVAVTFALDLCLFPYNASVLHIIPLLVCAKLNRRRWLVGFGLLLIFLTYLGYFAKVSIHGRKLSFYMPNRHLVALTLLVVSAILYLWQGVIHRLHDGRHVPFLRSFEPTIFEEIEQSIARLVILMLCVLMIVLVLLLDLVTPAEINFPILFAIPLVIGAWARSLKLLWTLVPILCLCTWIGFVWGPPASNLIKTIGVSNLDLIVNRTVANLVILAVATILHVAITQWNKSSALARSGEPDT